MTLLSLHKPEIGSKNKSTDWVAEKFGRNRELVLLSFITWQIYGSMFLSLKNFGVPCPYSLWKIVQGLKYLEPTHFTRGNTCRISRWSRDCEEPQLLVIIRFQLMGVIKNLPLWKLLWTVQSQMQYPKGRESFQVPLKA